MTIGGDTFISEMMKYAGFRNIFENKKRYPEITNEDIKTDKPQFILLSSEPFPFKEKELKEFKTSFPETTVILVDGEMFSWYGSRLMKAPAYFLKLREKIEAAL